MPLVIADSRLAAMWEQEMRVTVASLVPALAARLRTSSDAAETIATALVAQMRLAVDRSIARGTDAATQMAAQFADLERQGLLTSSH
jgi:imidazolonepropionase-like amidohydrolase